MSGCRHLWVILGDQLDDHHPAFSQLDKTQDVIWMAEVSEESQKVWSHKARIVLFLSAMRHYRERLEQRGFTVDYTELTLETPPNSLITCLSTALDKYHPHSVHMVLAGEWEVQVAIESLCRDQSVPLTVYDDPHFMSTPEAFKQHADGRKQLRMEYFYREMRLRHQILMDQGKPLGGQWNFDHDNRGNFEKSGPSMFLSAPLSFSPDAITQGVIKLVKERFADHPGILDYFDWPVTPEDAQLALDDFIQNRLPEFGRYQDAMWLGTLPLPYLYHSRLSAAMNLKLLNPRKVIDAAVIAYESGLAPIESVEGFVRQILGWREYVRGIYWRFMPDYLEMNKMKSEQSLPAFYWTAETNMTCLHAAIQQTLDFGYAHHIQRLMVTGLFALLLGVNPKQLHEWYLAVYVDAVEWVELPNTLGMSQFGDGGLMASKPYIASGKYIQRMSNYCDSCRFKPDQKTGDDACPFTTLYWDYLIRHEPLLQKNARMGMQLRNLGRLTEVEKQAISKQAHQLKLRFNKSTTC